MTTAAGIFYRPTENHVGVIYRWGRFRRFANPDHWSVLVPWIESVVKETSLDMRSANVQLINVYTRDNVAIDMEMKIFFFVDMREVSSERRIQVLRFASENAWEEIVRTGITDITRNHIIVSHSYEDLKTREGRSHLKEALSSTLAERVEGFGILVNPRFGVNIINLQPNEVFQHALQEESAAKAVGSAAVGRIRPLFEQFKDQEQETAFVTLIMQIASAVAKNAQSPDIIFPNTDFLSGGGLSRNRHDPISPAIPRKSQSHRPKSMAGD